ncbi:MAG: GerMN domain-containing protein [Fimbriimonadaceae bacterium]|nr:GerMN domain-containing protein [Fimbriimonadaceae bacterium]
MAKKSKAPIVIVALSAFVLGGSAAFVVFGPGRTVPPEMSRGALTPADREARPVSEKPILEEPGRVSTLAPKFENGDLTFDRQTEPVSPTVDPVVQVVNDFLRRVPAVPKEAVLKSAKISSGLVELDFNQAFQTGYGTEDEQVIVNGILTALAQFQNIDRAQFLVEGKALDALSNIDLTEPQPVIRD